MTDNSDTQEFPSEELIPPGYILDMIYPSDQVEPIHWEDHYLVGHAMKELSTYGGIGYGPALEEVLQRTTIDMLKIFSTAGHSGFSASLGIEILTRLLKLEQLTPLTSHPDEWMEVHPGNIDEKGRQVEEAVYQNRRNSKAFSNDGGYTYYVLDEGDRVRNWRGLKPWEMKRKRVWHRSDPHERTNDPHHVNNKPEEK